MRDHGEFKFVTRRKKGASHVRTNYDSSISSLPDDDENDNYPNVNYETVFRKVLEAEVELKNSLFADNVFYYLRDSLSALNVGGISNILCYGLGHFSYRSSSKYQLALLLSLKKHYNSKVHVYDPVFSSKEIKLLKGLDCNIIQVNEEGKHFVHDNVTLIYMPHCPTHLINNFLYANWSRKLNKCILLTNSFSVVVDDLKKVNRSTSVDYISRIRSYATEIPLRNSFRCEEAFNDISIHIFLEQDVDTIPESFWNKREEPCYRDEEIDYLTAKQTEGVDAKNSNYTFNDTCNDNTCIKHVLNGRDMSGIWMW